MHVISPAAEEMLDKEFRVLDKGFVRLIDYMGNDSRIVAAARVSYGHGTKSVREDQGLIDYLVRNQHLTPLEQVILTFHCKMPIFVARQWNRTRTARMNEVSARYSVLPEEFYIPEPDQVRAQSAKNKQGRDGELPESVVREFITYTSNVGIDEFAEYNSFLEDGVARELARINLPLSTYTEWYWQIDLRNLFNFLDLRLDGHAQYEIREYAKVLMHCAQAVAPMACASFDEHILHGERFSKTELKEIRNMITGNPAIITDDKRMQEFLEKLRNGVEE